MNRKAKDQYGREKPLIDQLNDGLECFTNEIGGSEVAERVDIGLVSFGGEVTVEQDFQPIKSSWLEDWPPTLSAGGHTPMCEAVVRGLKNLESYIVETDSTQERALVWLLTDGKPNETEGSKWEKTKRKIEHRTADDDINLYAVGLGEEADMETLGDLVAGVDDENKSVFHLEEVQAREFFMRASENLKNSENSQSESSFVSDVEVTEGNDIRVGTSAATIGPEIGTGAEGTVYHIQGNSDSVLKIFNKQTRDEKEDKVRAMIKNLPIDPTYEEDRVRSIIWPQEIAEDPSTGAFLGYKMPYKNLDQTKRALEYAVAELKWDDSAAQERYRVALNLALVVKTIHEQGHAIGDLNHDKILIDDGLISLIDCDAFHITDGNKSYPGYTYYPRYSPSEGRPDTLEENQEADRFGLGVHIFQFLMEGFHPFQAQGEEAAEGSYGDMIRENPFPYDLDNPNIRPHEEAPNYDQLPEDIKQLFSDCFHPGGKLSLSCPTPEEWMRTLTSQFSESGPEY